ncbi:hypothetical protein TSPI_00954 [Trichinella spiralis]|uniref:Secreted protein n=1 Tax=Trichinella spiralis TaxID=6334 RepID=A0ABR3KCS3_TRISP
MAAAQSDVSLLCLLYTMEIVPCSLACCCQKKSLFDSSLVFYEKPLRFKSALLIVANQNLIRSFTRIIYSKNEFLLAEERQENVHLVVKHCGTDSFNQGSFI